MTTLLILLFFVLAIWYIKLLNEKRLGFIGGMSIIITTFYNVLALLLLTIFMFLKNNAFLIFLLISYISLICAILLIYCAFSIYSSKRYGIRRKYIPFEVCVMCLSIVAIVVMIYLSGGL